MRTVKFAVLFALLTSVLSNSVFAQTIQDLSGTQGQLVEQVQQVVPPRGTKLVSPTAGNKYYFGMQVQLNHRYGGTTLRIVSVTPGSPAQRAGLENGDEIRTVNGQGFHYARDSYDAVAMMNRFVDSAVSISAPAAAASTSAAAYVMPRPSGVAQLLVRNVRNGQNVWVTVQPQLQGWGGAPAATAPTYSVMDK